MRLSISHAHWHADRPQTRWPRIGVAGFLFFLLKGLLWLVGPALLAHIR